jgi:hypothetical protein
LASSSSSWASTPTSLEGSAVWSDSGGGIVASQVARAGRKGGVVVILHTLDSNHRGIAGFGLYHDYKNARITKKQNRYPV